MSSCSSSLSPPVSSALKSGCSKPLAAPYHTEIKAKHLSKCSKAPTVQCQLTFPFTFHAKAPPPLAGDPTTKDHTRALFQTSFSQFPLGLWHAVTWVWTLVLLLPNVQAPAERPAPSESPPQSSDQESPLWAVVALCLSPQKYYLSFLPHVIVTHVHGLSPCPKRLQAT